MVNLHLSSNEAKDGKLCIHKSFYVYIKALYLNSDQCQKISLLMDPCLFVSLRRVPPTPAGPPTLFSWSLVLAYQLEEWGHTSTLACLILNSILLWSWIGQEAHEPFAIKTFNFNHIHLVSKLSDIPQPTEASCSGVLLLLTGKAGGITHCWSFWGNDVDHSQLGATSKQVENLCPHLLEMQGLVQGSPLEPYWLYIKDWDESDLGHHPTRHL